MTQPEHIQYRDLATLKRWGRNYRQGDVGAIIQSIARFGFNGALRVWRDDVVIAGNHALMALLQMKASAYQTPRGIVEHGNKWLIPCIDVSHLNEIESEAYAIADNKSQERGDNDNEQLAALLSSIAAEDAELLRATGYDGDDVDNLLRILANDALGPNDPYAEWRGMPEFDQEALNVFHSIKVHFETPEDLKAFAELVKQTITENTVFIYYPKQEKANLLAYKVIDES
jgi:hypothetical protein